MIGQHNFISLISHNQKEEPEFEVDLSFLSGVRVNLSVTDLIREVNYHLYVLYFTVSTEIT